MHGGTKMVRLVATGVSFLGAVSGIKTIIEIVSDLIGLKDDLLGKQLDRQSVEMLVERVVKSLDELEQTNRKLALDVQGNTAALYALRSAVEAGVEALKHIAELLSEKYGEREKADQIRGRLLHFRTRAPEDAAG